VAAAALFLTAAASAPPGLAAFVTVATLLAIVPGADTALVTRNTLAWGTRVTLASIAGIACGCMCHAIGSALGLAAILRTSRVAFTLVKTTGAIYLIWIGIQAIREARKGNETPGLSELAKPSAGTSGRAWRQGFLTNILNPKVSLFYMTLLPQFIAPGEAVLAKSLMLASIHIGVGVAWLTIYSSLVSRLGAILSRPAIKATLERVTGAVLIALGIRLAWERA